MLLNWPQGKILISNAAPGPDWKCLSRHTSSSSLFTFIFKIMDEGHVLGKEAPELALMWDLTAISDLLSNVCYLIYNSFSSLIE